MFFFLDSAVVEFQISTRNYVSNIGLGLESPLIGRDVGLGSRYLTKGVLSRALKKAKFQITVISSCIGFIKYAI